MRILKLKESSIELQVEQEAFASGGEGGLHFIKKPFGYRKYVAKIYHPHKRKKERQEKIEYLIAHPPAFEKEQEEIVVWPEEVLLENGDFVGFMMPLIKGEKLEVLCSARLPRKLGEEWQHFDREVAGSLDQRLQVCYRLAEAVHRVHETNNYVLVDLKPDNVMLKPNGHIALVDMDSVEVLEKGKAIYSAPVATPEYTPPEYYRKEAVPGKTLVPESWDLFSLTTIFYKMLLGIHPYAASAKPPLDKLTTLEKKIEAGLFVYANSKQAQFQVIPPPHAAFERLPIDLQQLFILCFEVGHELVTIRPTALDWTMALRGEKALALKRSIPSAVHRLPVWDSTAVPDLGFDLPKIDWATSDISFFIPYLSVSNSLWLYRNRVHWGAGIAMGIVAGLFLIADNYWVYHYLLFEQWAWPIQVTLLLLSFLITLLFVLSRTTFYWQYLSYRIRTWRTAGTLRNAEMHLRQLENRYKQLRQQKQIRQKSMRIAYQALFEEWETLAATYREKLSELDAQTIRLLKEEREALAQKGMDDVPEYPLLQGLSGSSVEQQRKVLLQRLQEQELQIEANLKHKAIYQRYEGRSLEAKKRQVASTFTEKIALLAKIDIKEGKASLSSVQQEWNWIQKERAALKARENQDIDAAFQQALEKRKKRFKKKAIRRFQRLSIAGQRRALKRRLKATVQKFLDKDALLNVEQRRDNLRRALGALTKRKRVGFAPKPADAQTVIRRAVQEFEAAKSRAEVEQLVENIPEKYFSSLRIIMRKEVYEAIRVLEAQMRGDKGPLSGLQNWTDLPTSIKQGLVQVAPSRLFSSTTSPLAKQLEQDLNQLRAHYRQIRASIWRHGKEARAWHKRFETWFYPWYSRKQREVSTKELQNLKQRQLACLVAYERHLQEPVAQAERIRREKQELEAAYAERDKALAALTEEGRAAENALKQWQAEQQAREQQLRSPFDERYEQLLLQGQKIKASYKQRLALLQKRIAQLPDLQRSKMERELGASPAKVLAELHEGASEIHELNRKRLALDPEGKPLSFKSYKASIKNHVSFSVYK